MQIKLNPYDTPSISQADIARLNARQCCPICDMPQHRRWRYHKPWTRCATCQALLGIKGPLWIPTSAFAVIAPSFFAVYRRLSSNPTWIIDYLSWLYLIPVFNLVLYIVLMVLMARFGRLVAISGWLPASEAKTNEMRIAYQAQFTLQEPSGATKGQP